MQLNKKYYKEKWRKIRGKLLKQQYFVTTVDGFLLVE